MPQRRALTLTPNALLRGADDALMVSGSDFTPGSLVTLRFDGGLIGAATTKGSGAFTATVMVPGASTGAHPISATDAADVSASRSLHVVSLNLSTSSAVRLAGDDQW